MNPTPRELVAAIDAGPAGPRIGAFFDLDGTIVQGYTAGTFYADRIRRLDVGPAELARTLVAAVDGGVLGGDAQAAGEVVMAGWQGRSADELSEIGERLFVQKLAGTIRGEVRDLIRAHRRKGHVVVIASSATRMQIEPIAADLGIEHVLCTELDTDDGILTGTSSTGMLWGERKAAAVRRFARAQHVDLAAAYGYANGHEDIAFLGTVGHPHALNPHPLLRAAAESYGWPVVRVAEPRSPGLRSVLGTAASLAGLNAGFAAGALVGLVTGDRRRGINAGLAMAGDAALGLGGVRLDVQGAQNLDRARPAVFVFNHQSSLDGLVLTALLRRDFTGVAKREARYDPRMWLVGAVLDPAYVDRSDPTQAHAALDTVVRRIREEKISLVISPEGTRTPSPTLYRFKKGAFHVAMQAGVPVVPVVIRNAGELMWRRSMVINPGVVDVCVLDPIPTDDWRAETLDAHVAQVRQLFTDTLDSWPGATR